MSHAALRQGRLIGEKMRSIINRIEGDVGPSPSPFDDVLRSELVRGTSSHTIERRRGGRLLIDRAAELVVGARIIQVRLVDMSSGGCAIKILGDAELDFHRLGACAALCIPLRQRHRTAALPLLLRNRRIIGDRAGLGFQFLRLTESHREIFEELVE
jgi:PilZ domain